MKKGYLRNVVNEAYLRPLKEEMRGAFVYVLVDATPYEFSVYGIYSDPQIAERALQSLQKEEGEDPSRSRFELKKVPLNEEPGFNYIPD